MTPCENSAILSQNPSHFAEFEILTIFFIFQVWTCVTLKMCLNLMRVTVKMCLHRLCYFEQQMPLFKNQSYPILFLAQKKPKTSGPLIFTRKEKLTTKDKEMIVDSVGYTYMFNKSKYDTQYWEYTYRYHKRILRVLPPLLPMHKA